MKFRAAILEKIDSPLIIKELQTTSLSVGQVLVKVLVSGLCGAQLQEISGHKGNSRFLPHLLGHEGCGVVEKIGDGVTNVKVGDKVVMHWRKGNGIESDFPNYLSDGNQISGGKVTTISTYSVVSENRLTKIPTSVPDDFAALLGCGLTTALGIITNEAKVLYGESVLILGSGGVGLNLIQGARLANAHPIVSADRVEIKKVISLDMGASKFINLTTEAPQEKFDVIIDTTGSTELISQMFTVLSERGRLILVAQPTPGKELIIPNAHKLFTGRGQQIIATQGGQTCPTTDIPLYIKLFENGLLNIDKLITHRFKLDQINLAISTLKTGLAGRIMIDMF